MQQGTGNGRAVVLRDLNLVKHTGFEIYTVVDADGSGYGRVMESVQNSQVPK